MSHVGLQLHSMLVRPACLFWFELRLQMDKEEFSEGPY